MMKFLSIVALGFILSSCSGTMEYLTKHMEEDESIAFGRVNVINPHGKDITDLCKIVLKNKDSGKKKITRIDKNGLYVAKASEGGLELDMIHCMTAGKKISRVGIGGVYTGVLEPGKSHYMRDLNMKLYYIGDGNKGNVNIKVQDSFAKSKQLYKEKMNNLHLEPIVKSKWNYQG